MFSILTTGANLKQDVARVLKQTALFKKLQDEQEWLEHEARIKWFKSKIWADHDCKRSQDSGCKICEELYELKSNIRK